MTYLFTTPRPIPVALDGQGERPRVFEWMGTRHTVEEVLDLWRVDTKWWEGEEARIAREYWRVITDRGLMVTIFRDMKADGLYLVQIFD